MSSRLEAIIKVGKSSDIKFNNVQAYRALTYREVEGMLSENESISFVVFEEVLDTDVIRIKNILKSFNILAVIYNKQGIDESITNELGIHSVRSLKDLQLYIESQLGARVATFKTEDTEINNDRKENINWGFDGDTVGDIEQTESAEQIEKEETTEFENNQSDITSDFNEAIEALNSNFESEYRDEEEKVQNADIMSKEDLEDDTFEELFDLLSENKEETLTLEDIEQRKRYEQEIESLNSQLSYALENVKNLSEIKAHLEDEVKQYKSFIESLKVSDDIAEVTVNTASKQELENKISELQLQVDQFKLEIADYNKLKDSIDEFKIELDNKDREINELQSKLANSASNDVIKALNKRIASEVESRLFVTQSLVAIINELMNTQVALDKKMKEVGQLINEYKKLELTVQQITEEKDNLAKAKQDMELALGNQITALSSKVTELTEKLTDAQQSLLELESKNKKIAELEQELADTKSILEMTQRIVNEQNLEVRRYESMGVEEMKENILALQESNSTLAEELGKMRRDNDELQRIINEKNRLIASIDEENRALKISLKAAARQVGAGESMRINCDYTGRAFVIPVFGSGSYGITSTAVSLAYELKGRVLIMDLDIVSPKIDLWFKVRPMKKELPEIDNEIKKTGFGALVEKGTSYVIKHMSDILININHSKDWTERLDYFSGIYTKIDLYKLMAVDFSEIFTYLGNEYDYIVVDCGRIGGSEITNALIKMLDSISFKNVIVALNDGGDCRTLYLRLQMLNITLEKSLWVLNLAKNDKVDELTRKIVPSTNYIVFGRDMKIYGDRIPYNKVSILKDRLKQLTEMILR